MRIIGNDQKNNGQNFWEILERIIGKISSIIGAGLKWINDKIYDHSGCNDATLNGSLNIFELILYHIYSFYCVKCFII